MNVKTNTPDTLVLKSRDNSFLSAIILSNLAAARSESPPNHTAALSHPIGASDPVSAYMPSGYCSKKSPSPERVPNDEG